MGGLISNNKAALYGGVNQQSAEHRLETQVEECINAFPTIDNGLLKRNPTTKLPLTDNAKFTSNMFSVDYDRGLSGDNSEKYLINILNGEMEVLNIDTGKVYTELNGNLIYDGASKDYLLPFVDNKGYASITIKDTTFIVNKNVYPKVNELKKSVTTGTSTITTHTDTLWFNKTPPKSHLLPNQSHLSAYQKDYAPSSLYLYGEYFFITSSITTITVDGIIIKHDIPELWLGNFPSSYNAWFADVVAKVKAALPTYLYTVKIVTSGSLKGISIKRIDGTAISTAINISIGNIPSRGIAFWTSVESDYYNSKTTASASETITLPDVNYTNTGYIWVSGANPATNYTYSYEVKSATTTIAGSVSGATTTAAATNLAASINAQANFFATANGSVVKIVTSDSAEMTSVIVSDTFGNQASFGWTKEVQDLSYIPKNFTFTDALIKVTGTSENNYTSFWATFDGKSWKETLGYQTTIEYDMSTMPHILVRNSNDTFTFKQYDAWSSKQVGDDETNKIPSFARDNNRIKDIFFFKNRLGFITDRTVVMSEVGEYGNFWRTTVVAVLDSDRIDTTVGSTKAISLEYATYIEDSVILFSDKAQFRLKGGDILSPNSVQIPQSSSYEINKNVRPVFMNNKIFFATIRGEHTAIMQYEVRPNADSFEAVDMTAHVQSYIPKNIKRLSGSSINNMLFIESYDTPDTIYVYKYLDSGNERVQSAWFKWTYNANIYLSTSLGGRLYLALDRYQASAVEDWVLETGIWDGSPSELSISTNFEYQDISPIEHTGYFVDASEFIEDTNNILGLTSTPTSSSLVYSASLYPYKDIEITLIDDISSYSITATMFDGTIYTSNDAKLTIPRQPANQLVSIEITINDTSPVEFNGFSCYNISTPSIELLYNSKFNVGLIQWTYTNWDIRYGTKDIGSLIPVEVDLGEWIMSSGGKKINDGILKMKTCQINSEDGSDFSLNVYNVKRDTHRSILAKYTVDRNPMIYGDSKDIRLSIKNNSDKGFKINSVVLEGNFNSRNRRI